jgi:hypothetical protein
MMNQVEQPLKFYFYFVDKTLNIHGGKYSQYKCATKLQIFFVKDGMKISINSVKKPRKMHA